MKKDIEKLLRSKGNVDLYVKVSDVQAIVELLVKKENNGVNTKK